MADKIDIFMNALQKTLEAEGLSLESVMAIADQEHSTSTLHPKEHKLPIGLPELLTAVPHNDMEIDVKISKKDELAHLILETPDELSPEIVGGLLAALDAMIFVPTNYAAIKNVLADADIDASKLFNTEGKDRAAPDMSSFKDVRYLFWTTTKSREKLKAKLHSNKDFPHEPWIAQTRKTLAESDATLGTLHYSVVDSEILATIMGILGNRAPQLSKELSLRDKINFVYSMCSDNVHNGELTASGKKTEEIFKQFLLQNLARINNAERDPEKGILVDNLINRLMISQNSFDAKVKSFMNTLGTLKQSDSALSMIVVLDNGEHVNLFDLDKSKTYHIMHSMNVSKAKQDLDFSNLVVNGDFVCQKIKAKTNIIFPKRINGSLDCSNCDWNTSFVHIPDGTTSVNFAHTVNTLSVLQDVVFPASVREILLNGNIIKKVLKDGSDLFEFEQFADKHPNIKIWNSKHTVCLQGALEQKGHAKEKQAEPIKKPQVDIEFLNKTKNQPTEKTEEWLTRKEILNVFRGNSCFNDISLDDKVIRNAAKQVNIKFVRKMHNNNVVVCVHIDDLEDLRVAVLQYVAQQSSRAKPKGDPGNQPPEVTKTEKQTKKKKHKLRIVKYIPKSIWKDICSSCKDSSQLLYSVLESINSINKNYTTQPAQESVQYIDKDGTIKSLSLIKTKGSKAVAQAVAPKDNRRIVWTINPKDRVMVAIGFFSQHDKSDANEYNAIAIPNAIKCVLMDGRTPVDKELVQSDDYLNVADLLQQYQPQKSQAASQPEKQKPVVSQQTNEQESTPAPAQPRQKRKRIDYCPEIIKSSNISDPLLKIIGLEKTIYEYIRMIRETKNDLIRANAPDSVLNNINKEIMALAEQDIQR